MREYLASHEFGSGNSDDLIVSLAKAAGKGDAFATSMRSFLDQPGIPLVRTEVACKDGKASLALAQSRYLPFGVLGDGAAAMGRADLHALRTRQRIEHRNASCSTRPEQRFDLGGGCPDWYLPNAQARGYYRFDMAPADLAKLGAAVRAAFARRSRSSTPTRLTSAFQRGDLGPAAVLDAMPALASSDMPQVATALLRHVRMDSRAARRRSRARRARCVCGVDLCAAPGASSAITASADDTSTTIALRQRLADFLALIVRDSGGPQRARDARPRRARS